ncbi:hydrogenase [Pseudodesulfovibrio sp. F-1]|uniref:Hydrogenase n=1 Tax=Pseudodesulfovibrio alkaliphilus TaxID=2661613 RepID=A0A7K1KP46_9BACT|nr:4Fe-4S dicluster domain-containing protein [Pseudodesulfovibrio alkaliphilus]MUM77876.1 hydrogenase [Pseudodesulfovibrio alkaliphilus]
MAAKFIAHTELDAWLGRISERYRALVPRREGNAVVFRPFDPAMPVELKARPTESPKAAVFPRCEALLAYKYEKDPEEPGRVEVEVAERRDGVPTVVIGGRPCDAAAFKTFDRVYDSDRVRDLNYLNRREMTVLVSLVCSKPATTCFCHWMGGGPASTAGSDVLMTPVADGHVFETLTARGDEVIGTELPDASDAQMTEARKVQAAAEAAMGEPVDVGAAREKLLALFDDAGFWEAESAKCISCGVCTYLCPTCYCFNITDEKFGHEGVRLRTWDYCMSHLFTMEASGHNPRPTKAHRLKNRVGHKFSYYPSLHGGNIACCGCGRCIRSCPASVDIRAIVLNAIAAPAPRPKG